MSNTKQIVKALMPLIVSAGVVATGILASIATSKAQKKVEEDRKEAEEKGEEYGRKEAVESGLKYYIPTAAVSVATILCVLIADGQHRKTEATLVGSATAIGAMFNKYKSKLQELYGNDIHEKVVKAIAKEPVEDTYLSCGSMFGNTSLDFGSAEKDEVVHTFYEPMTKRYFDATFSKVLQAEYHLNRNFILGMDVSINDFFEFLGLAPVDGGDNFIWAWGVDGLDDISWIDFDHIRGTAEYGQEVYTIVAVYTPVNIDEIE